MFVPKYGIISRKTLIEFYNKNPDAKGQIEAWYKEAKRAKWKTPSDIKAQYRNVSFVKSSRVVFNICGNKYRLVVKIHYQAQIGFIRFIGSHEEYDKINVEEI